MELTIICIILLIYLLIKIFDPFSNEKIHCSNNDGNCYKVSTDFAPHTFQKAADELSRINNFNAKFITYLRNKYLWTETNNPEMKAITMQLIDNYNPDVLKENNPSSNINTSYVLEKGRSIAFCLREKESGKHNFENRDMLDFVNLHEISHLAMSYHDPKHSEEFWRTFKLLSKEATESGLYKPIDWSNNPKNYCGLEVDYNPYYDNSI